MKVKIRFKRDKNLNEEVRRFEVQNFDEYVAKVMDFTGEDFNCLEMRYVDNENDVINFNTKNEFETAYKYKKGDVLEIELKIDKIVKKAKINQKKIENKIKKKNEQKKKEVVNVTIGESKSTKKIDPNFKNQQSILEKMDFKFKELNLHLLKLYNGNLPKVISLLKEMAEKK